MLRNVTARSSTRAVGPWSEAAVATALLAALAAMGCDDRGPLAGSSGDGGRASGANADEVVSDATASDAAAGGPPSGGSTAARDAGAAGGEEPDAGRTGNGVQDGGGSVGDAAFAPGAAAQPSSGCGAALAARESATIQVNGTDRQYVISLPAAYDASRPYPLVLAFHGAGLSGPQFRRFFDLVAPVGSDGIVVYPTGTGGRWDVRSDFAFVDALLMELESDYCVDTGRIFATGHSNGAFFTNALGCLRGDVFRAIAPMSGGQQQRASSCTGEVAAWISHGDNDTIVVPRYGRQARDFWVGQNGCEAGASEAVHPSPCVEYQGCRLGVPVRYCEYPGDHFLMADSARTIWDFFRQF